MIQVRAVDGTMVSIPDEEAHRIHREMEARNPGAPRAKYISKTKDLMEKAQHELEELTGDSPEDLDELYEFAAKHRLFGGREDTHLMYNYFKVFYALLQEVTHN